MTCPQCKQDLTKRNFRSGSLNTPPKDMLYCPHCGYYFATPKPEDPADKDTCQE